MRDIIVARRTLLAFAASVIAAGAWIDPAAARSRAAHPQAHPQAHPRHHPAPHARHQPAPHLRTIALDPGHGGVDPGAISPHGFYEKRITLATALELARQLAATRRYRPVLTRHGDVFVPLRTRVARARAAHADVFLSIHADALPDSAMRGLSVYTLSEEASDREAGALAARENKDDFVAGVHLHREPPIIGAILLDLAQRQTNNRSLELAQAIVAELGRDVPLLEKPHRSAGFAVLTAPDIPSALVELGCLSNPQEERLLPTHSYQRRLAHGLVRAIDDYFATASPA